jgi:cold shock protein
MIGKVKWFFNVKGYAFIGRNDDPGVFAHYSAILGDGYRTLMEGDATEFEIVQVPKGLAGNRGAGIALTDRLSIGLMRVVSNTQKYRRYRTLLVRGIGKQPRAVESK